MDFLKVILTSFLSVVALFVVAKFLGHKQIGQLDFFDYITGITIGSIAAELATELEEPIKPLIAVLVYGITALSLSILTGKYPKMRKYVNGTPTILMDKGKIYYDNMKKAKLDLSELMLMCRQAGYFNLNDIESAIFEYNGRLSILPSSTARPLNPNDVNLKPEQETICTEVVMEGHILDENLKRHGLNDIWLKKQLEQEGYGSVKNIFLAICDANNKLYVFEKA